MSRLHCSRCSPRAGLSDGHTAMLDTLGSCIICDACLSPAYQILLYNSTLLLRGNTTFPSPVASVTVYSANNATLPMLLLPLANGTTAKCVLLMIALKTPGVPVSTACP